ncbi:MAG: two-component system response regulator [Deltaproteobacteria bacterium]|nr:two-component system response regulator [Deltaproteobacteria bacterium]
MRENPSNINILIVDDTKENISILLNALKSEYSISVATSGPRALDYIGNTLPDLILLDVMMPGMNGYEVCAKLKQEARTRDIPIIFITAMSEVENKALGFELGAVDYITKPFEIVEVKARVKTHISLKQMTLALQNQNQILEEKVRERTQELRDTQLEIVYRLGRAAEYRDNETGFHIKRISHYCVTLGQALGMTDRELELLYSAASMHDIGKIGIPDHILLKPAKLDREEWAIMQTHTAIGFEILSGHHSDLLQLAGTVALTHHEKWDGSGYPQGLKGEEIPLVGRVTALGDVFDALISRRPYKKAWPVEDAVAEIIRGQGSHFDPRLVGIFQDVLDELIKIKEQFLDVADENSSLVR